MNHKHATATRLSALLIALALLPSAHATGPAPTTFSNTNALAINDSVTPPTIATPYPSTIVVTGLTGQVITKVTVTLSNLTHSFPSDIDALLVGPQGQMMFLMSEVGGASRLSVTNITLTLDDDATNALPIDAQLTSGTFQPTKSHPTNYFDLPPPAPPGNSNAPAVLGAFTNTDPNGTWSLLVVDDTSVDSGAISGGWSLTISSAVLLDIAPADPNVVVSWTNTAAGYTLQTTASLAPPEAWTNALPLPASVSGRLMVTNPATGPSRFYRLIR